VNSAGSTSPRGARTAAALLVIALALGGCALLAPPKATAPSAAEQRTALVEGLAIESQWLQSWFKGTPVLIAQRSDGTVTVDVPREFCFDRGRSAVKPALAAVLDKVAESLKRRPQTQLIGLAAPDDRGDSTPLALQRAAQVHRHLRDRGIAAARLGEASTTGAAAVQLRIGPDPPSSSIAR
jgi:outer membrane protein OmpA-like peptidoglycan-associated protein